MLNDLTPWFIGWALLTTAVVVLALWRNMLGLHDMTSLFIAESERQSAEEEDRITRKIARIETWGKALTVASAMLILGIGIAWFYKILAGA
jgi:hypothetical protein